MNKPALDFGDLLCTAGLPGPPPCGCRLCELENTSQGLGAYMPGARYNHAAEYAPATPSWIGMDLAVGPDETVTWVTQVEPGSADTIYNTGAIVVPRETKMTNREMFNPSARDGAALFVALRLIPVTLALALIFQAVAG